MTRTPPRGSDAARSSSAATERAPLPRGIRNHNPLNIRSLAVNDWRGEVPAVRRTDAEFEQFEDPVFGLRAAIKLIRIHYRRGADTIRKLATVWAPPGENPHHDSYISTVVRHACIAADTVLDLRRDAHLKPVLLGMIRAENGVQPYSAMQLDTAFALAAEPRNQGAAAPPNHGTEPRASYFETPAETAGSSVRGREKEPASKGEVRAGRLEGKAEQKESKHG